MTVVITGWRSAIAEEFRRLLPTAERAVRGWALDLPKFPLDADRYLFCQGLLRPKREEDQTEAESDESYVVNYCSIMWACDLVFEANPHARVCIIGSESGYRGSFDGTYARAKAMIHRYIEERRIGRDQQLVGISPGIIEDCRMTTSRTDVENLRRRREQHPKQRFLQASEVAAMARTLLYFQPYVTGTVVRMHGGDSEHKS